jgi:mRNA interferase RelE/StbE
MTYTIRFRPAARREYLALPKKVRLRMGAHLEQLAGDPHGAGTAPLHGDLKGRRKLRLGDYRVVYSVDSKGAVVRIIAIGHRAKVYRDATRRE